MQLCRLGLITVGLTTEDFPAQRYAALGLPIFIRLTDILSDNHSLHLRNFVALNTSKFLTYVLILITFRNLIFVENIFMLLLAAHLEKHVAAVSLT